MKRFVILAGVLAASTAAQAQDAEIKHSGEFRLRYYNDMTPSGIKDQPENKSDIEARTKVGLTMKKGPAAKAHVTLIHGTLLGASRNTTVDGLANPNAYDEHNISNGLIVNEAYGWAAFSEKMFIQAGRFGINHGGGEFMSTDDHKLFPTTHEGIMIGYDHDIAGILAGLAKDKELNPGTGLDSDPEQHRFMVGVNFKNLPEFLNTAALSFSNFNRSENTGATVGAGGSANLQVYGLTLGGESAGFNYRGVLGMQSGIASKTATTELKQDAMMYDVRLGYSMPETMGLKVWANYHSSSGDDDATDNKNSRYSGLYYDSHKFAGLMDIFGWGNLTYWAVGADVAPADDMTVGLGLYGFSKAKENDNTINGTNNDRFAGLRGGLAGGKADLGMELDVYAQKKYANGLVIDALVGAFMPGAAFKDATPKRDATIIQAMLTGTLTF